MSWCGSLEEALAWPQAASSLQSINVMFQVDVPISDPAGLLATGDKLGALAELRARLIETPFAVGSTVPPAVLRA